MSEQQIGFGYQSDTDENLKSVGGGKFGLNQNVRLVKFEYNSAVNSPNGSDWEAVDVNVMVEGKLFMARYFSIDKVKDRNNNDVTDKTSDAYKKLYNAAFMQLGATLTHILKSVTTETAIKNAITAANPQNFASWAKALQSVVPSNFASIPLDVALQYQWGISKDQEVTFLELPKNMKGGYWIVPAVAGVFTEDRSKGLRYVNAQGQEHPFNRDEAFMKSFKAYRQGGQNGSATSSMETPNTNPSKSAW
jgi:hypothetical protein